MYQDYRGKKIAQLGCRWCPFEFRRIYLHGHVQSEFAIQFLSNLLEFLAMSDIVVEMFVGEIVVYHLMDDDIAQRIFLPIVVTR